MGQYYAFYTAPLVAGDNFNPPIYNAAGLAPANGMGVPLWVGATRQGFSLRTIMSAERVEGDIWGGSVVDLVYRGGNMFLSWDAVAFRAGSVVPMWPWNILGSMGTIGRLGSVVGGSMVLVANPLTPAGGTPAIGQIVINSLTAPNAILAEDFDSELLFDSRLRRVPIRMRLLPYFDHLYTISSIAPGTSSAYATAGFAINNSQPIVAGITPSPATGSVVYSLISTAAYKWYTIM